MEKLIASGSYTITDVADGHPVKDNLFSATNFALNKYTHPTQPTVLVSWQYNGKPNTKYTLSTDIPKNGEGYYQLFFDVYPSTPSSLSNGVAIDEPRTITTDETGIIEITARKGVIADSIITKTSHVKLEENDRVTAFIFHPDDQIGEKGDQGPQGIQGLQGVQGIPGVKGADGKTQYTHIAYADNATGGGFSQTDQTKAYIGMYQDFSATDSTNPISYRWSKWKGSDGAQGIPGPKGADGQTPYLHFAYSDNADGTDLTTSDNGQRYIGQYSDYAQADSTDKTKYRWADRWAKIKVSGRNLAQKTSADWSTSYTNFNGSLNSATNLYKVLIDDLAVGDTLKSRIVIKYTDIIPASGQTAKIMLQGRGNVTGWRAGYYNRSPAKIVSGNGELVFEYEFPITADHLKNEYWDWQLRTDYIASGSLQWKLAKVEKGTVFTGWSPAPEDTQELIDSKADQALTQQQLNALTEQDNLIKAEMEAKAGVDTVDKWITAYQNYVNANDADKKKSEQALQDASNRLLQVNYDVNELKQQWNFIDTYMSVQNEGLIIGKKDGSAYAKFSDDRISLFSGSSEVMYISQGTLNIANGIFTKTIQIGRFRFEAHPADEDMLVLRYLGG